MIINKVIDEYEKVSLDDEAKDMMLTYANGDARQLINLLMVTISLS